MNTMMRWQDSVWFFDVDDTLVNTAEMIDAGATSIVPILEKVVTEKEALQIRQNFFDIFQILVMGHRLKKAADIEKISPELRHRHEEILTAMARHQTEIIERHGKVKQWSREAMIKLAADEAGISLPAHILDEAADAYWTTLAEESVVFEGVLELFQEIIAHDRPVFLLTGSDAHLQLKEDEQFHYDPEYSTAFKMRRIHPLKKKGITYHSVSIGDPVDKPLREFYENAIKKAEKQLGHKIDLKHAIMIGDSFESDLRVPKEELGFGLVVLIDRDHETSDIVDEHYIVTGNLAELPQFLSN